ncbi:Peptidase S8/S53 domain containing protein [Russula decolorans]
MMRPLFSFYLTFSLALVLAGLLQPSLAAPSARPNANTPKLKDAVVPPSNWIDLGPAPPLQHIWLRIALPQARFSELERQLYEISDPKNARYGQHLLKEQVTEFVRPDRRSVEAVDTWLAEYGITGDDRVRRSVAGDWVTILVPVAVAEEMLDTEFHLWKNVRDGEDGDLFVRTTQYSLPEHLHAHIELVQPTTYFGRPKPMSTSLFFEGLGITVDISSTSATPSTPAAANYTNGTLTDPYTDVDCSRTVTIPCLRTMYNVTGYVPQATSKNKIGITGYLGQFANNADLQSFYKAELPAAVNSSFQTVLVNGLTLVVRWCMSGGQNDQTPGNAGPEANLDTQFGLGMSFPTPGTFYSTGGAPPFTPDAHTTGNSNEPYDDWLQFMLALRDGDVPQTISTSYSDDEQTVPKDYATRVCKEFGLLGESYFIIQLSGANDLFVCLSCTGSRGVSIIFSSGDAGVGDGDSDPATQQCFSNDGKNNTIFLPQFPASCPFVTTVGGTQGIPEVAAPFSGGGFSNYFARPDWQNATVQKYLDNLPSGQYQGLFNPAGRAYPDVSAQSRRFLIYFQGLAGLISGTSAAAPTFAGIVSLLNDANIAAGKPPLGFLNPMLYSIGVGGLNDITQGNAPGCGTPGFSATTGWDPVTGLGTPNFAALKNILVPYSPPVPKLLGSLIGALLNLQLSIAVSLNLL